MSKTINIIKNHYATFREFDTGKRTSSVSRFIIMTLFSGCVAYLYKFASDNFLSGLLSAQSILVGFGFNALLYLITNRRIAPESFKSIEHELKIERLSLLGQELFYNVSYFNLTAIMCVALSLCFLTVSSGSSVENISVYISAIAIRGRKIEYEYVLYILCFIRWVTSCILYILIMESVYTFIRTLSRLVYYFEKLRLLDS